MSSFFPRSFLKQYPIAKSAKGIWITDSSGKEYLDGCSGAIVCNLGHGVEEIIEAIVEQSRSMAYAHTSQFLSEPALALCEKLVGFAPKNFKDDGKVSLSCGGSEAVETAIKMARSYFVETGRPTKHVLVSRRHSYHGATLGALSATGHPARRKTYLPMLKPPALINTDYKYRCQCGFGPGPCQTPECDIARANELEEAIQVWGPENVMAFMGEPIVGAALGAAVPGPGYWRRIREICTKYDVLLIADEVMVGLGRCGANFAMQLWDVEPDLIVVGKGLSAGYQPLGAVIASTEIVRAIKDGSGVFEHGFTYSGHPTAAAAGLASLKLLEKHKLIESVKERESVFFQRFDRLRDFPGIGDIRGRGFLAGIELVADKATKRPLPAHLKAGKLLEKFANQEGLLVYPGSGFIDGTLGDNLLIAPPFTATEDEIDELFVRLERALSEFHKSLADEIKGTRRLVPVS